MTYSRSHISSKRRLSLPRLLAHRQSYTAREVRQRLQIDTDADARTAAVHAAAAQTSVWCNRLRDRVAYDLGRSADRLPTVVHWYRQGLTEDEIGKRLSPFGTNFDAQRAIDAATALIAEALNSGDVMRLAA
jgi:hypothetical protein